VFYYTSSHQRAVGVMVLLVLEVQGPRNLLEPMIRFVTVSGHRRGGRLCLPCVVGRSFSLHFFSDVQVSEISFSAMYCASNLEAGEPNTVSNCSLTVPQREC
jgi:hypothetical protein